MYFIASLAAAILLLLAVFALTRRVGTALLAVQRDRRGAGPRPYLQLLAVTLTQRLLPCLHLEDVLDECGEG